MSAMVKRKSPLDRFRAALIHAESAFSWRQIVRHDPCVYCVIAADQNAAMSRSSVEHIQPKAKGGGNGWRNETAAHQWCNEQRGNRRLLHFLLYRRMTASLSGKQHAAARRRIRISLGFHGRVR